MRYAIDHKKYSLIPRRKNMDTLARLGLTSEAVFTEIYALTYADYYLGPEIDRDYPDSDPLWVFKTKIDDYFIYIKFKIIYHDNGDLRIISFHIDHI
jgi:hypothetical protein